MAKQMKTAQVPNEDGAMRLMKNEDGTKCLMKELWWELLETSNSIVNGFALDTFPIL